MRLLFISMTLAACGVTTSAVGFDTTTEIGIAAEVVGTDLVSGIGANRTLSIWAVTPEGWRIEAVAGNSEVSMRFEVIGGHFYQHDISESGGPTSADINPALFSFYPDNIFVKCFVFPRCSAMVHRLFFPTLKNSSVCRYNPGLNLLSNLSSITTNSILMLPIF